MQVLSNHKSTITLPRILNQKEKGGKDIYPPLKLKPGMNEPDEDHLHACLEAANNTWLRAMLEPGAMRRDGKATLEILDDDPPISGTDRRPAKDVIEIARTCGNLDQLELLIQGEGDEPRKTVMEAIEKRMAELGAGDAGE